MQLLNNRRLIALVIASLALLKFIIMPLISWQEETVIELSKQNKQLQKGLKLVENQEELLTQLTLLKKLSEEQNILVAGSEPTAIAFQLNVQKKIETMIEKYELRSRSATWLNPVLRGKNEEHRLEISLAGSLKGFIQLLIEIEQQKPKLSLIEFRSNISRMYANRGELGQFTGQFTIVGWRVSEATDHD